MNRYFARICALLLLTVGVAGECVAADPGRLFYTPAERAKLEAARAGNATQAHDAASAGALPVRFDGVVIRSDGRSTSWVNGQLRAGGAGMAGLKPGQLRADGKVYEPYQVLRARPARTIHEEPAQ
jgi:hypothetical protein